MARKKKAKNEPEISKDLQDAAVDSKKDGAPAEGAAEAPAVPDVPDLPPPDSSPPPPPPPSRTAAHKFDLPPIGGAGSEKSSADKGKGVLKGILERTQEEAEKEAAKLMDSLKVQQDAQRMAREEEERRKAAEARARVDEERRRRDAALKEYEERQRRKEAAETAKSGPAVSQTTTLPARKSSRAWIVALVVGVVVVAGGVVGWKLMSGPEPVAFLVDSPIERARGGSVVTTSIVYGPSTLRMGRSVEAEALVAGITPEKYEAPAPAPVIRKKRPPKKKEKLIEIRTGIIGGKKVVR